MSRFTWVTLTIALGLCVAPGCSPPRQIVSQGSPAITVPISSASEGRVDSTMLMRDVQFLASDSLRGRSAGTPDAARAAAYIERRFRDLGVQGGASGGGFRQSFDLSGDRPGSNVLVRIPGRTHSEHTILLTAHYDHVGVRGEEIYNGADDNASGVAALFAIAEYLQARPPEHTVLLAALDGEEIGLQGARALAAEPPVHLSSILVTVNLDMVSRHDGGALWVAGTSLYPHLFPILEPVIEGAGIPLRPGHDTGSGQDNWTGSSDHAAFHRQGVPFLYFGVEDHSDYHRPTDDVERIRPAFFTASVEAILSAVLALDGSHEILRAGR